jgi:3'-phosphoadenosine 5'-phosphosulfate sulfotransferase (PAPS reductase)/FAD synthetase
VITALINNNNNAAIKIFTFDIGRLFPKTYEAQETIKKKYKNILPFISENN